MLNMFTNFFEIWKHECIAPAVLNMVTMFSTSEPRKVQYRKFMYRAFGTQHGYDTQQHRKIVLPKSLIS